LVPREAYVALTRKKKDDEREEKEKIDLITPFIVDSIKGDRDFLFIVLFKWRAAVDV